MPKMTLPEKWLNSQSNHHTSRFVVENGGGKSSLVRIPLDCATNERGGEENNKEKNGGPEEIRTPDPRHVKAVS